MFLSLARNKTQLRNIYLRHCRISASLKHFMSFLYGAEGILTAEVECLMDLESKSVLIWCVLMARQQKFREARNMPA